jgi:hypothetical protein
MWSKIDFLYTRSGEREKTTCVLPTTAGTASHETTRMELRHFTGLPRHSSLMNATGKEAAPPAVAPCSLGCVVQGVPCSASVVDDVPPKLTAPPPYPDGRHALTSVQHHPPLAMHASGPESSTEHHTSCYRCTREPVRKPATTPWLLGQADKEECSQV